MKPLIEIKYGSPCMFHKFCDNYTPEKRCDDQKIYKGRNCHQEKLDIIRRRNAHALFGDPFRENPENIELTKTQEKTLAKITNALFNGGDFLAA